MTTLSFDVLFKDRGATKGLNDLAKSADKTSAGFRGMKVAAAVGLVAATAAAVKFGASSVRAYSEAQSAQLRLQDAFAKFPRLANTNIGALRNLNTELAKKTRFDDDATASGQAVLAQFKLTGQQITQLTPLLQDYAAKTGKDLPTAARDLGKAMLGQGRSLKAVGINFKDTGTAGGNFTQIMQGLRSQVGGFAEREGKTAAGQAEILKNQFGELQESVGQALLPALLKVGGGLLKAVSAFNNLDDSTKSTLLTIGGGIATLGLSALAVGKLAVGVRSARDAFQALGITAKGATIATAGIGLALGAAALAFGAYAQHSAKAKQAVEDYTQALKEDNNALGANVRLMAAKKLQDEGAFAAANKLGIGLDTVTDAAIGNAAAQARLNPLLDSYVEAALNSADVDAIDRKNAAMALIDAIGGQNKAVNTAVQRARELSSAAGTAGTSTAEAGVKVKTAGEKAADAEKKLQALAAAMFKASRAGLELSGSEISFQQAVDDASAAVKANGRTLDTNTQKGRDNRTALNNLVTSSQAYIQKLVETNASSKRVTGATKNAREEFIRVARRMGESRDRAKELADRYFKIPKNIQVKHTTPGSKNAIQQAKELKSRIQDLRNKGVRISFSSNASEVAKAYHLTLVNRGRAAAGRGASRSAQGGLIKGPGTGTSDSILGVDRKTGAATSWVSNNEFVVNAKQTRKNLRALQAINNGLDLHGFATGGVVRRNVVVKHGDPSVSGAPAMFDRLANRVATNLGHRIAGALGKVLRNAAIAGGGLTGPAGPMTTFRGGRFTTLAARNLRLAEQRAGVTMHVMQGGWRPRTSYSGTSHAGDAVDTQASARLIRAIRSVGWASGDRTGLGNWGSHAHSVPGPRTGRARGSAVGQYQDYLRRGGARQGLRSPWGLADGGLVRGGRGGVIAALGEGLRDELVTPLPKNGRAGRIGSPDVVELGPRSIAAIASALTVEIDGRQVARAVRYQTVRGTT